MKLLSIHSFYLRYYLPNTDLVEESGQQFIQFAYNSDVLTSVSGQFLKCLLSESKYSHIIQTSKIDRSIISLKYLNEIFWVYNESSLIL